MGNFGYFGLQIPSIITPAMYHIGKLCTYHAHFTWAVFSQLLLLKGCAILHDLTTMR